MDIEVKVLDPDFKNEFPLPKYSTPGSSGLDLRACITDTIRIFPGETVIIPTGIAIHINDPSLMATIVPRSGLGSKGLVLGNLVGIIDSDYQGEIKIPVWNRTTTKEFFIKRGDRICQMIFIPIMQINFKIVEEFINTSSRADGGFGHSGTT